MRSLILEMLHDEKNEYHPLKLIEQKQQSSIAVCGDIQDMSMRSYLLLRTSTYLYNIDIMNRKEETNHLEMNQ